ncbi:MAG: ferritin family protein [Candidatus Polarisedimenticolaceae bacterium]|nr:ferritin family protein [Candidatus Polarisedimenticolaceae bacterium]
MNIIEYALEMEKDGERYYRDLALNAKLKGIQKIFNSLADAEAKHYRSFLQLRDNLPPTTDDDENILLHAKNIFKQIHLDDVPLHGHDDQVEIYKKARQIEDESRAFYLQKAAELSDPAEKELCLKIAEEELQHSILLDAMIDFISRPYTWLENAEWSHLDSY